MTNSDIKYHKLKVCYDRPSPNRGGKIVPSLVVMHYTAGHDAESAIQTLSDPKNKASAHVVIDTNGAITQLVPFNRAAWHAGPSEYQGLKGINNHSIGIELVNPGYLREVKFNSGREFQDWAGNRVDTNRPVLEAAHPRVGSGKFFWPIYPEKQIQSAERLVKALIAQYPTIYDVVSHEEIDTRGWKTDPGPAFPMERFKTLFDDRSGKKLSFYDRLFRFGQVTASNLNVRGGPGVGYDVIGSVSKGKLVRVTGIVPTTVGEEWLEIEHNDEVGYVASRFVKRQL